MSVRRGRAAQKWADSRGNDGGEAGALDDNVWFRLAADLRDHRADELAFSVAIRPDHEVRRLASFGEEVRFDAPVLSVLPLRKAGSAFRAKIEYIPVARTHLGNIRLHAGLEELYGVAAVPLAVLVLEIIAGQVPCDGRNGKVGVIASGTHRIREAVVLDPFRCSGVALRTEKSESVFPGRRRVVVSPD